jgi:ABC-type transport system involved in multi-copper enzyme maturation permease subunit
MTATITPYQSTQQTARDGFAQLLHAEWTKLRTVRGWVITLFAAAAVTALAPIDIANSAHAVQICTRSGCQPTANPAPVTGPGGGAVTDDFYFLRQSLAGNGSITVRVTSLRGSAPVGTPPPGYPPFPSTQPWAKAGVIVKAGTKPGSPYAAVMATPGHGARMQYNFTGDIAGPAGAVSPSSPRWLRLTRSGSTLTGYSSADGTHWAEIGTASLAGLPRTVQAGLFVASPDYSTAIQTMGGSNNGFTAPSQATAVFDHVSRSGQWSGPGWSASVIGKGNFTAFNVKNGSPQGGGNGQFPHIYVRNLPVDHMSQSGGRFTVAGSGDVAPFTPIVDPVEVSFYGTTFGLIAAIALGAMFITSEYRRGMIRTTFTASPHRGRVLAAKAIVIGSVTFVTGLIGAAVAFAVGQKIIQSHGWTAPTWQVWSLTSGIGVHVVVGTAAMLALAAVLALALGTVLRRAAGAVTSVIVLLIFPVILGIVLPLSPANWLLRLTPAAAFSLQQALPQYAEQTNTCLPYNGCYPLAPWAGFAVLCAWALVALAGALFLVRRRDA